MGYETFFGILEFHSAVPGIKNDRSLSGHKITVAHLASRLFSYLFHLIFLLSSDLVISFVCVHVCEYYDMHAGVV